MGVVSLFLCFSLLLDSLFQGRSIISVSSILFRNFMPCFCIACHLRDWQYTADSKAVPFHLSFGEDEN